MNIKKYLEENKHDCGLNADWAVSAYHVKRINTDTALYFFDNENGFFSLTLVSYDYDGDLCTVEIAEFDDETETSSILEEAQKSSTISDTIVKALTDYLPSKFYVIKALIELDNGKDFSVEYVSLLTDYEHEFVRIEDYAHRFNSKDNAELYADHNLPSAMRYTIVEVTR